MPDDKASTFIKAVTTEGALFTWRTYMAGAAAIITAFTYDIKSGTTELKKELAEYRLAQENRISRVEGEINGLKGSVSGIRERVLGLENETRLLSTRMYEVWINRNQGQKGTP